MEADGNCEVVRACVRGVKAQALGARVRSSLTARQQIIDVVNRQLVEVLGGGLSRLEHAEAAPTVLMLVGLKGSGKTTTIGKLAKYFQKRGKKVAAVGLDVHRPAAPDQLAQVMKQINAPAFINKEEKDAVKIYEQYEKELAGFDVVLVDTAGRDALSEDLIKEINDVNKLIKPDENLLVISADIGQAAKKQAEAFHS